MDRQAKIIATLGPATSGRAQITALIKAGADAVRINCSHGNEEEMTGLVNMVRDVSNQLDRHVAVILDLQGPKIRIGAFKDDGVLLKRGDPFFLDSTLRALGDQQGVKVLYNGLAKDCRPRDILLLDDGRITLRVLRVQKTRVYCKVINGGMLYSRKGLNKSGGGLSARIPTPKDRADIRFAARIQADYVAVSFPRSAEDMKSAGRLLKKAGGDAGLVAKIERAEAVQNPDVLCSILQASDGAMIARGDLGVEIGDTGLIGLQKDLIALCRTHNRFVITATQMMETMIENPVPTRAEVFDVANAVLDGTDAVMLSAETATGRHPHLVVQTMAQICRSASGYRGGFFSQMPTVPAKMNEIHRAIAAAAVRAAHRIEKVTAMVSLTESGSTPLLMSRVNTNIPIYALSRHQKTLRRMALYRDVVPLFFKQPRTNVDKKVIAFLHSKKLIKKGDRLIFTFGDLFLTQGATNTLKVLQA